MHFYGTITPEMLDPFRYSIMEFIKYADIIYGYFYLKQMDVTNLFVDNISTYFMKPVQIDTEIEANATIIVI